MSDDVKRLGVCSFGFALGITWAIGILLMGWVSWWSHGWAADMVKVVSSVYIGYKAGFWGGIIGAIWAFVDWFIGGVIIAWFYNMCTGCCRSKCKS